MTAIILRGGAEIGSFAIAAILCDLRASVVNSTCQKLRETWRLA